LLREKAAKNKQHLGGPRPHAVGAFLPSVWLHTRAGSEASDQGPVRACCEQRRSRDQPAHTGYYNERVMSMSGQKKRILQVVGEVVLPLWVYFDLNSDGLVPLLQP
jgi:hypothetical protein